MRGLDFSTCGWVGGIVLGAIIASFGCGETKRNGAASGGTPASGDAGAGAGVGARAGMGGVAPTPGSSSGGGGEAGAPELGGAAGESSGGAPPVVPCTESFFGGWVLFDPAAPKEPAPDTDACWNLVLRPVPDQPFTHYAVSRLPSPESLYTHLVLIDNFIFDLRQARTGMVEVEYGPECLVNAGPTPTCAELGNSLDINMYGEGLAYEAACTPKAGGGCKCSLLADEFVSVASGTWTRDEASSTMTFTITYPSPAELTVGYAAPASVGLTVCGVVLDSLTFSEAFDELAPGSAGQPFLAVDCSDGPQSIFARFGTACVPLCAGDCL